MAISRRHQRHEQLRMLQHQIAPVRHLLDRCHKQKGLLIWHAMGSGKSIIGSAFIASLQRLKTVLVLPADLTHIWNNEASKINVNLRRLVASHTVRILTYEKSDQMIKFLNNHDLKDYALVADEAHHLIDILKRGDATQSFRLIAKLKQFSKILLLTGTPMFDDATDFRFLVNIAAGKNILPIDQPSFEELFYKTSLWRSVIIGWFLSLFSGILYQVKDVASAAVNYNIIVDGSSSASQELYDKMIDIIRHILGNFYISAAVAVAIPVMLPIIALSLFNIALRSQTDKIRLIDATKVVDTVQSYVSYYDIPTSERGADYPSFKIMKQKVEYNPDQIDLWLRFAMAKLTPDEMVRLGIRKSAGEAFYFGDIKSMDDYKFYGRVIGNLDFVENSDETEAPKFLKILGMLANGDGPIPTVIYSNFARQGTELFASFLKRKRVDYLYLHPRLSNRRQQAILNDFRDARISVLILHPALMEGISIAGARQMHVLEPVINQSVLEQIIARVLRYGSHSHLKPSERSVTIHTWSAVAGSFYSRLSKFGQSQKLWSKHQMHVGPWYKSSRFPYDITPDGLIETRNRIFIDNRDAITDKLKSRDIKSLKIARSPSSCSLFNDIDADLPICSRF